MLVAYAFKFALKAEMNQGCIPSLFSVTSIYISILFYFSFNEVISVSKIIGTGMVISCVVLLSMDPKEATLDSETDQSYSVKQMKLFGILAVVFGVLAPSLWTFRTYYSRLTIEKKWFVLYDMSIDSIFFQNIFALVLYIIFLT